MDLLYAWMIVVLSNCTCIRALGRRGTRKGDGIDVSRYWVASWSALVFRIACHVSSFSASSLSSSSLSWWLWTCSLEKCSQNSSSCRICSSTSDDAWTKYRGLHFVDLERFSLVRKLLLSDTRCNFAVGVILWNLQ